MTKKDIAICFVYAIIIWFVFSVQSANSFLPDLYGYKIDILVPLFISIVMYNDLYVGIFCGAVTGFVYEYNLAIAQGVSFIYFTIIAILVYFLSNKYYTKNIITTAMFATTATLFYKLIIYLLRGGDFLIFFQIISAEVLISIIFLPVAYVMVLGINRIFKEGE